MTQSKIRKSWNFVRQSIVPPIFVVFFTIFSVLLVTLPRGDFDVGTFEPRSLLGNKFSWGLVACWSVICAFFIKVSSKTCTGPTTSFGFTPTYADNGFFFYCVTLILFLFANFVDPNLSMAIYDNMVQIVGTLNMTALLLCCFLCYMGHKHPQHTEPRDRAPVMMKFYRGIELHPKYFGIDVKQFTNCRFGLMGWQLLILAYFITSVQRFGFNPGMAVNVFLQSIYIAKFFWWEAGYFTTLDITLDRAGYYLCWGCMVYVTSFYTFSTYYFVNHLPRGGDTFCLIIFVFGLVCTYLNYAIDHQKEVFRKTNGRAPIWGKQPEYIAAEYRDAMGKIHKAKLLISGYWGICRHLNYVFEIGAAVSWVVTGMEPWPFMYAVFLTILLVHRIYRDEDKCARKYGRNWNKYCETVKYRLIPFVY